MFLLIFSYTNNVKYYVCVIMIIVSEDMFLPFENYFHRRATVADQLYSQGDTVDARILATTALDALAEIWLDDFPKIEKKLNQCYGGGIPASIRLSQLLKHFAKEDRDASKVSVVCFAEDWKLHRSQDSDLANRLLDERLNYYFQQLPQSSCDLSLTELEQECPQIAQKELRRIAEEYEYGALLYKFYRCALVHSSTSPDRINGFARGEEVRYSWSQVETNRTTIGFGCNLITRWLRIVATNYVQFCREQDVIPAEKLDAGMEPERRLRDKWINLK